MRFTLPTQKHKPNSNCQLHNRMRSQELENMNELKIKL